ncbi:PQQ-binding-like beta-propeller repeat protein [Streptomyces sp. NPDC058657]|uniref:outer membrane protein assembly factor BamB family protein n=1 Tax=unclassified Streptomyces TaxID=2593676 RepID=UPI0036659641
MSQPPNQPPQGGFGAPQDPQNPQGGVPQGPPPGVPQQPPAPPQMPGTPPPGQPGYGYPQGPPPAADNPYAQPTPPPGQPQPGQPQPGYGYPGQPGTPPPPGYGYPQQGPAGQPTYPGAPMPAGPGGGGPQKQKLMLIIGAAVAALIVIGGGIYLVSGDDEPAPVAKPSGSAQPSGSATPDAGDGKGPGDTPGRDAGTDLNAGRKPGEAKVLWANVNKVDLPKNGGEVMPSWFVGDTVIQTYYRTMTAYGVADGKKRWELQFPNKVCGAPQQKGTGDKVVIGVEDNNTEKAKCNQMQQVDLKAGKTGWRKEIPKENLFDILSSPEFVAMGDTITVSRMGVVSAFRISDGSKLFGDLKFGACGADAFASNGSKLIAIDGCGSGDDGTEQVREADPATGKGKWAWKVPKGWAVKRVFSVEPLVLYMENKDKKAGNVSFFKSNGAPAAQMTGELPSPQCGWAIMDRALQGCTGVTADATTLYVASEAKSGGVGTGRSNEVRAYDVTTGKRKWVSSLQDRTLLPVKTEDGSVFAYAEPTYDKGGEIVKIPAAGGSPAPVLKNPEAVASLERSFFSKRISYEDGRLFLAPDRISGKDDEQPKTLLAFGN